MQSIDDELRVKIVTRALRHHGQKLGRSARPPFDGALLRRWRAQFLEDPVYRNMGRAHRELTQVTYTFESGLC